MYMGQRENKLCPNALGGDGIDMLSVGGNNFLYDGQAQACSFFVLAPGGICLVEALPDFFHAILGNADALVFDGNEDLFMAECCLNGDFGIIGAELDGVIQKIVHDLLDFAHVRGDELLPGVKQKFNGNMAGGALSLKGGNGVFDQRIDIKIRDIQTVLLGIKGI